MKSNVNRAVRYRRLFALVLGIFVAAHLVLSRVSASLVQSDWGVTDAFLYVPVRPDTVADHGSLLAVHYTLRFLFYPIWQIDNKVFGGPWSMWSMPLRSFSS